MTSDLLESDIVLYVDEAMRDELAPQTALHIWRKALTTSFRDDGPDLSARQMAIMLDVYLTEAPHTVRGLAHRLNISKPAVVRALDVLSRANFLKRRRDETDRRNVLIQRTVAGSVFLRDFADHIINAAQDDEPFLRPTNDAGPR